MKRKISFLLVFLIMINTVLSNSIFESFGQEIDLSPKKQLVIGYFDIWCRSDGTTWLKYNGQIAKPDSIVNNIKFPVAEQRGKIVKDIEYFTGGKTEFDNIDYKSVTDFNIFEDKYYFKSINKSDLKLDKSKAIGKKDGIQIYLTEMYIRKGIEGEVLPKKSYQGKKVLGIRYYIPMVVTFVPDPEEVKKYLSIDVSFTCEDEIFEGQDINFNDLSKAYPQDYNEITKEELIIRGINGTSYYNKLDRSSYEIANGINPKVFLMEGEYELILKGWDTGNNTDTHTEKIKVKKAEKEIEAQTVAIETSPPTSEIGETFTVSAKNSFTNKGMIIKYQHYVSIGDDQHFTPIPQDKGGNQKEFQFIGTQETDYYFKVEVETTEGQKATSEIVKTSLRDNTSANANAEIDTINIWYEGLYENVRNKSTIEIEGAKNEDINGTWSVSSKIGKRYSSNSWKFYNLFEAPKKESKNYNKKDFKSSEGGKLRFNTIGERELWLRVTGKGGSKDIDTKVIDVRALPLAQGEIEGNKKNREVIIHNKSLFKPQNAWQNGENGEIDDTKTVIKITNLKTGEVAISAGGKAFNKSWVKGLDTEFDVKDEDDYTHQKNDITRVVFTGDHEHDQLTEIFKFEIDVTDKRGNTSHWEQVKTIYGDINPISRIDGIWNYIRNPFTRKAQTELYETSYSKDNDDITVETKEVGTNKDISPVGVVRKIPYEPDKVGKMKIRNKAKDSFINKVYSGLRKFLSYSDELEDEKEYTLSVENVAPSASLEGIKSESLNLINFIDADNDVSSKINQMTQDIFSETKTKIVNTNFVYREDKGTFKNATNLRRDKTVEEKISEMIENDIELKNLKNTSMFKFSNENEIYKYFYFFNDMKRTSEYNPYKNMNVDIYSYNFYFYRYNKILDKIEKISEKRLNTSVQNWSYYNRTKHIDYYSYHEIFFLKNKMVVVESREVGKYRYTDNQIYVVLNIYDIDGNNLLDKFQTQQLSDRYKYRGVEISVNNSNLENLILRCKIDRERGYSDYNWTISYNANTNIIKTIETEYQFDRTSPYMMIDDAYSVAKPSQYYFLVSDPESSLEKKIYRSYAFENFTRRKEFKYFLIYNYFEYNKNRQTYYIDDVRKDFLEEGKKIDGVDSYNFSILAYEDNKIYIKKYDKSYIWDYKNDPNLNNLNEIPSYNSVEIKYDTLDFEDRYVKQWENQELVPKMIDYTYKLNQEVTNFNKAKHNYLTIFVNKDIMFGHLETLKMQERIRGFNEEHNLIGNEALKPLIVDIGGNNEDGFRELVQRTNGIYIKANSNNDGINKIKEYLKSITGVNKARNVIQINRGDILELKGNSIDYESDPITLEQYRLRGENWGNFGNSITKLQGNNLQFNDYGTFVIEYQNKDNPPSIDGKDYGKFSNIATLIVQVGDGDLPEPPKIPPSIDVKILSQDGEYRGKERRRLDFVIMAHEGTNSIDWNSLKIDFDKSDYLPSKSENDFTNKKAFSRIFTQTGTHKIIVELADTTGLSNKVEIPFEIIEDLEPTGNFDIVGDGKRNSDTGLAQFFINNETASSPDNDEFEVTYYEEVPRYTFDNGNLVQNGLGWGELDVIGKMFETSDNVKVRQLVEEYYSNGVGLNGETLDKDGYRIFKSHETIKEKSVIKEPPKLEYKVNPKVIVVGESVTHISNILDDTNKPKIQEYKFTHDPNILQNNGGVNSLNNTVTTEATKKLDYKGLYHFYSKVIDEDNMTSNWVDGGTVKVVSKPIADFEPYTTSIDSESNNKEYENDVFGKNSVIQIENKAWNEDYGNTLENYGFKSIKMEYRNIKDGDFTEFYNADNLISYPQKFTLPSEISKENGIYEIRQKVVSIDGIESECIKQITVLDFRLSGELEPQKIYPGQTYKIKAKVSKDSIGAVAYIEYLNKWVTLNQALEDNQDKYFELYITTVETIKDGDYPIKIYGLYPYNLQKEQDLVLTVNTPIGISSDVITLGPDIKDWDTNKILENNNPDNDYIKAAASENVKVEATVNCPIPVKQVEAWIDGEGSTFLTYNSSSSKWEGVINVRSTKVDKNNYPLKVRATAVNGSFGENTHRAWIYTPIKLTPNMPSMLISNFNNLIDANTAKYANTTRVTLFKGTAYETTLTLNGASNGNIKEWSKTYLCPSNIPEGNYVARFISTTPNGNTEIKDVNFKLVSLNLENFRITDMINHPKYEGKYPIVYTSMPVEYKAGYKVTFNIDALGTPDEVKLKITYPSYDKIFNMKRIASNGNRSIWEYRWYAKADTPKNTVINCEIWATKGTTVVNFNNKYSWNGNSLKVVGSVEDDLKINRTY